MHSVNNFVSNEFPPAISPEQSPIVPLCRAFRGALSLSESDDEVIGRLQQKIQIQFQKHADASKEILGPSQAFAAFLKGDERAVAGYIKRGSEGRAFLRLVYGQEQKSAYTIEAENMFNDLFANFQEAIVTEVEQCFFIRIKNKEYNLSQLLPLIEYDRICLAKEALEEYRKLLLSDAIIYKPEFPNWRNFDAKIEQHFKNRGYVEPEDPELRLSLAEKFAINIYTSKAHKIINPVMRNQIQKAIVQNENLPYSLSPEERLRRTVLEALVHIAVFTTGVRKLPSYKDSDGTTKYFWRLENEDDELPLLRRRRAVEEGGGVEYQSGFFSCSRSRPIRTSESMIVTGALIKGEIGKDISFFSEYPDEGEIVFLAPFIRWKYVKDAAKKGLPIPLFIGEVVPSSRECSTRFDFESLVAYFLSIDLFSAHDEFSTLPLKTRANFCAFLIQTKQKPLESLVATFFQSHDALQAFSSVDSKTKKILLSCAREQKNPNLTRLIRLFAQSLATQSVSHQMIKEGALTNSASKAIDGLREFFKNLANHDPQKLQQYFSRENIQKKILSLKAACEIRFTSESLVFCGQDSLNRELLTSTGWNGALSDPEVILALFALEAVPHTSSHDLLNRLSYALRTITSMVAEGVKAHHPVVLETLPLNRQIGTIEELSHLLAYIDKKEIHQTFVPIYNAIEQAYRRAVGPLLPNRGQQSLFDIPYTSSGWVGYLNLFDAVVRAIRSREEAALFASEAKTSPEQLKKELQRGFSLFCTAEKIDLRNTTLKELIEKMARSDEILDPEISHLMGDRLHFLIALRCQDITIDLKDGTISIEELFRKLFEFFARQREVSLHYAIAAEQFYGRLVFLAEKLSSPTVAVISREDLIRLLEESYSESRQRAVDILQIRTEELAQELNALFSHEEIRSILAEDFCFYLKSLQEIETLSFTALGAYRREVMTLFKEGYISTAGYALHGISTSIDDLVHDPCLALQFLKWIRYIHLYTFGKLLNVELDHSPTRFEKYEQEARKVLEFLNTPNKTAVHEIKITDQFINNNSACTLLSTLPLLEKIHIEFTLPKYPVSLLQKMFQTFSKLGLDDKIEAITFNSSAFMTVPNEVCTLRNLRELSFLENCCDNLVPCLANTPLPQSIQKVTIAHRLLAWIPRAILNLKGLRELHLHCFELWSIPDEISNLENLQKLIIFSRALQILPKPICLLQNLIELELDCSKLASIPEGISSLPHLQKVCFRNFDVSLLPTSFWSMKSVEELYIYSDAAISIPDENPTLPNLRILRLVEQNGAKIKSLGHLKSLVELSVDLELFHPFPEGVTSLENLRILSLGVDSPTQFPASIATVKSLRELKVKCNKLTFIPAWVWQMESLQSLFIETESSLSLEKMRRPKNVKKLTIQCPSTERVSFDFPEIPK